MLDWRNLRLCIPTWLLILLDTSLTLTGQPAEYWQGDRNQVSEISPDINRLLTVGPMAFLAGLLVYALAITAIVLLLPRRAAMVIAATVTVGHTVGACTWILWRPPYGYQVCIVLCFVSALLLVSAFTWGEMPPNGMPGESATGGSRSWLRWFLVGLLLAAVAFVYAVPH
jgi:hypothetical protein